MNFRDNEIYFVPLGGSGEIGMNMNLFFFNGKWLMVDCGIGFIDNPGIDVIMPDIEFIEQHKKDLLGIVITHAHEDHHGAVPYLLNRLGNPPLYATPFTSYLLREKCRDSKVHPTIHEIPLKGKFDIGPFGVEFLTLTHSIPEPNALAISTDAGTIVHTGDWKIDHDPVIGDLTDVNRLKELGDSGVLALICDSTNALVPGRSGSESSVKSGLKSIVESHPDSRILVACFASNVARLHTITEVAGEAGREIGLLGRSLLRMDEAARYAGYFDELPNFKPPQEIMKRPRGNGLIICTGSQGEPRAALTRIARGEDSQVKLEEGDVVVFSSREIPGNEEAIARVQNSLIRQGVKVITANDNPIHVSGHPCKDELKDMYSWIRPAILIPVHGEDRHMEAQADLALECDIPEVVVPYNGSVVLVKKQAADVIDEVPSGRLALDGNLIVPLFSEVMRDRHRMMSSGVAVVTVVLDEFMSLKLEPEILLVGIVDENIAKPIKKKMAKAIEGAIFKMGEGFFEDDIKETIRIAARRVLAEFTGKKTQVIVQALCL